MGPLAIPAAALASTTLLALAALHVYWGLDGRWPAKTERGLLEMVIGDAPQMKMPGLGPCLVVAVLLTVAAVAPLGAVGLFPIPFARLLALGAAGVLFLRGAGGFFEARFRPAIVGTPYARLSRRVYSPLCLALAALLTVAAV